jgi:hypothetical protein
MTDREARIRERAYQLWIERGQPEGRSDEHWAEACRLVDEEQGGPDIGPAATVVVSRSPRRKRTAT